MSKELNRIAPTKCKICGIDFGNEVESHIGICEVCDMACPNALKHSHKCCLCSNDTSLEFCRLCKDDDEEGGE